jgi:hypothetical protein
MSEEQYEIQWLGFTPYLVYRTSQDDDFVVIELNEKQQQEVDYFQTIQYEESKNFAKEMLNKMKGGAE